LEALIFLRFIALTKIKEYNALEDLCKRHKVVVNTILPTFIKIDWTDEI
jgi:hypothetical protein